jgi:hypothetical protein
VGRRALGVSYDDRVPSCPICGLQWPAQIAVCPCGFAPSSMDHFIVQLQRQRKRGVLHQALGVLLTSVTIPTVLIMMGLEGAMILVPIICAAFIIAGGILFVRGTIGVVQTTRRLRAAREMRRLPVARIVD